MNKFTIITFTIFIFVFWIFWFSGDRVATDYHLPHNVPLSEHIFPWIWRETNVGDGLGEYAGITLWAQPLHSFFSILLAFSIPPSIQTKFMGSLVFILGFFSLFKLLRFLKIKGIGIYIGIIFYLTNSYFVLLFDGGQISIALIYAITPFIIYLYQKLLEGSRFKDKLFFVLSILLVSILDIRYVYILGIVLFLNFIFYICFESTIKKLKIIKESLIVVLFLALVLASFHAYWLLPSVLIKAPQLPQTYGRVDQVDFLSFSSVGHSLLLQQPHWYENIFGKISNLNWEFIFIPIVVFIAPLLSRRNKVVGFWLMIAGVGILLSKGSQDPFGQIYLWLFNYIPGFSIFRDPSKFYLLISLSYAILIAISLEKISLIKNKYMRNSFNLIPYIFLVYLLWVIRPVYLGEMTGLLSKPQFTQEFYKLAEYLKNDRNYSRLFWVPTKSPLGYVSDNHPLIEGSRYSQKRPFAIGTKGTYETLNFLRESPYMGEIFDVAGIGYIVYPYLDERRDNMHPDNVEYYHIFLKQLSQRNWLTKVDNSLIPLLKTKSHQDKFFITPNIWWVIGSDSIYKNSTESAKLKLSKNSLIFAEEFPNLGKKIDLYPTSKIVLNNKKDLDLSVSQIDPSDYIFPAKNLGFDPDKSGWWKREAIDLVRWRNFLQEKYKIDNQDFDLGGGWAIGEGNRKLKIENRKWEMGDVVLARVLESTRSGELKFYQNDTFIGQINTKKEGNNVRWFEVGSLINSEEIIIESVGDINVVNAVVVINENEWLLLKNKTKELRVKGRILEFIEKNADNLNTEITYKKINPTQYKVKIKGLTKPEFLVFSQNFDSLWKLNNKSSIPVYSLLNGFLIEKDGEYTISYEAQKYVYIGIVGSIVSVIVIVFLLIKYKKEK